MQESLGGGEVLSYVIIMQAVVDCIPERYR